MPAGNTSSRTRRALTLSVVASLLLAGAAPQVVASAVPQPLDYEVEGGASTSFVVPEGVTSLTFTVAGGAGGSGGSGWSAMVSEGGAGAEVSGTIVVRPGSVVSLQSGEAGQSGTGRAANGTGQGGDGYSRGGSGGDVRGNNVSGSGGGGGGSSALVIDGVPVVVAGGGGGGGGTGYEFRMMQTPILQGGGDGGTQAGGAAGGGSGGGAGGTFGGASTADGTHGTGAPVGNAGGTGGAHGDGYWSYGFEEYDSAAGGGGGAAGTSMVAPEVTGEETTVNSAREGAVFVAVNARAALDVTLPETIHRYDAFTALVTVDFIEEPRSYAGRYELVWERGDTQSFETNDARTTTTITLTPSEASVAPISIVFVPTDASDSRASFSASLPVTLYPVQVDLTIPSKESGQMFVQRDHDLIATLAADGPTELAGTVEYRVDGDLIGSLPVDGPGDYALAWRPPQAWHSYTLMASFVPHEDSAYAAASASTTAEFSAIYPTVTFSAPSVIRVGQPPMLNAYLAHNDGTVPGGTFSVRFTDKATKDSYRVSTSVSGNNVAVQAPELPLGDYEVFAHWESGYQLSQPGWVTTATRVEQVPTLVSIAATETWYPVPTAEIRAVVTNADPDDGRLPEGTMSFDIEVSGVTTTVWGSRLPGGDPATTVYLASFPRPSADQITVTAAFLGDATFASSESAETTLSGGVWPVSAFGALSQRSSTSHSRGVTYTVMVEQTIPDAPSFSGTAQLLVDGVPTGRTAPIANGKATLDLPGDLTVGSYRIAAIVDLSASDYGITTLDESVFTVNPVATERG